MMESVIDLHAHILHGIDDGPATLEESVAMVRLAAHAGTKEIVATVHASRSHPYHPALAQRRWEELQHLTRDLIRIHRACEAELAEEMIQAVIEQPARYTVAGSRYLLVELPDEAAPKQMEPLLKRLLEAGLRPILAQPELHPELARDSRRLKRWVQAGALVQVGAGSLSGSFGSIAVEAAARILKRGLAHFVASGAHDMKVRLPRLDAVRLQLIGEYPPEFVEQLLLEHPRAVIEDRDLEPGPLRAPFLKAYSFQFWR
jgi:protein-tyrosine phosphatase